MVCCLKFSNSINLKVQDILIQFVIRAIIIIVEESVFLLALLYLYISINKWKPCVSIKNICTAQRYEPESCAFRILNLELVSHSELNVILNQIINISLIDHQYRSVHILSRIISDWIRIDLVIRLNIFEIPCVSEILWCIQFHVLIFEAGKLRRDIVSPLNLVYVNLNLVNGVSITKGICGQQRPVHSDRAN